MKFLATATLLLASVADAAPVGNLQRKLQDHWVGNSIINDRGIYLSDDGEWEVKVKACGEENPCTISIPRPEARRYAERRQLNSLKIDQRGLEGVGVSAAPTDGSTIVGEIESMFSFTGLASVTSTLVFSKGDQVVEFNLGDVMTGDGSAEVKIYPGLGTWTWSVEVDGEEVESVGGKVTFSMASAQTAATSKTASGSRTRPGDDGSIVTTSGTAPAGGDVGEDAWEDEGAVQQAVGRIYFSSYGVDYACTGTVVKDNKSGRTLVFTAAHCIWDDIDQNWGSNAIFIPNRDSVTFVGNQTGDDIHRQCEQDVCGCWSLSGGVVHDLWRDTPWAHRLEYDYGFWVVDDAGSHTGADNCGSDALDIAVGDLQFSVGDELEGDYIYNFGYSLEYNPDFRYCTEEVGTKEPTPGLTTGWMPGCGLTGGASGGPWISDFDPATGSGKVVSVNSWSYSTQTGMGGPFIDASAARCLVNAAREIPVGDLEASTDAGGGAGIFVECHDRPCIEDEESVRKLRGNRKLCETTDAKL